MPKTCPPALLLVLIIAASGGCNGSKGDLTPPEATTATPATAPPTERVVGPLSDQDAAALAMMNDGLRAYLQIHADVERGLPALPDDATPAQIDTNQRAFERAIRERRASAKAGEIFTAEARPVILRLLATVFSGPDGRLLLAAVLDEKPDASFKMQVNARYPDNVPVSTVPLQVLQTLPRLTEDLEYRFIGRAIIILDTHAHTIVDFIENALPA